MPAATTFPPLRAWFWKEGRESIGKVLGLFVAYGLLGVTLDRNLAGVQESIWVLTLVTPGISAISVLSSERWQRTHTLIEALPIRRSSIYLVKWLCGLLTLLIPIIPIVLIVGTRTPANAVAMQYALSTNQLLFQVVGTAVVLYAWSMAIGARLVRSLVPIGAFLLVNALLAMTVSDIPAVPNILRFDALFPWMIRVAAPANAAIRAGVGAVQLLVVLLLFAVGTWTWSHRSASPAAPRQFRATNHSRQLRAWRFPVAIKAWREGRAALLVIAMLTIGIMPLWTFLGTLASRSLRPALYLPPVLTAGLGVLVAILSSVAFGARMGASRSADPAAFWSTRPIRTGRYFWGQFATELALLLALMILPALLSVAIVRWQMSGMNPRDLTYGFLESDRAQIFLLAAVFFIELPLAYAMATLFGALTRSAVLAVTFTAAFLIFWAGGETWIIGKAKLDPTEGSAGLALHLALTFLLIVAATLLARIFFEVDPFHRLPSRRDAAEAH